MRSSVHGPGRATAVRFSSTVSERKMLRSCGTQPMPSAARVSGASAIRGRPGRRPAKRRVTPTRLSISVVLPTPLRPSTASASPSPRRTPSERRWRRHSRRRDSTGAAQPCGSRRDRRRARADRRDRLGLAFGQQGAVDQHRDALREAEHQVHVVLDQQHRHVGGQGRDGGEDVAPLGLRHAGRRLVEQQHPRRAGEGRGDLEQPLLAVGQGVGARVEHIGEAEPLGHCVDLGVDRIDRARPDGTSRGRDQAARRRPAPASRAASGRRRAG